MNFRELLLIIIEDLKNHGSKSFIRIFITYFFNVSFRLLLNYRIGNYLVRRRNPFINMVILHLKKKQLVKYNCDISYNSRIGRNVHFPHPLSIIIGEESIVGNHVMIWQEVTLGSHGKQGEGKSYPVICDNVKLFSGCKIIGSVKVNKNSIVGANAVVINDVPTNHIAVGIPSKNTILKK